MGFDDRAKWNDEMKKTEKNTKLRLTASNVNSTHKRTFNKYFRFKMIPNKPNKKRTHEIPKKKLKLNTIKFYPNQLKLIKTQATKKTQLIDKGKKTFHPRRIS